MGSTLQRKDAGTNHAARNEFRPATPDHPIRTVIVGQKHIPFTVQSQIVQFDVPVTVPPAARSSTMDLHTVLQSPGLEIRIEHAFRERRAGKYAMESWPEIELQRQAASFSALIEHESEHRFLACLVRSTPHTASAIFAGQFRV